MRRILIILAVVFCISGCVATYGRGYHRHGVDEHYEHTDRNIR